MTKALLVIDMQNEFFAGGKLPLWNTEKTLENVRKAIKKAKDKNILPILIMHVMPSNKAPFFIKGSEGVKIHQQILSDIPDAKIIEKNFADGFEATELENYLIKNGIQELIVCGMMTQNCVTHTAISKKAEKYKIKVLSDCCTTTDKLIHNLGIDAISTRVQLITLNDI